MPGRSADAAGTAGNGYDTISTGSLNLDGSLSTTPFTITLDSLGQVPGNFSSTATGQHWTLVDSPAASQTGVAFAASEFNIVATGFTGGNLFSSFNVSNPSPGVLQLNYVPGVAPPNLTWSNGGAGGSGNWNSSGGTAWNNGTTNVGWNSDDGADFNVGSGTVTLTGPISAPLITFDVNGYTIEGTPANTLTATNGFTSLTIQVTNSGTTGTIDAPIDSAVTLIGNGTLVLGGANTFGGGSLTVNGGTLRGNVASLGGGNRRHKHHEYRQQHDRDLRSRRPPPPMPESCPEAANW